jgi:DICT domain-containing protein|tara:strand:- start:1518 stop:1853 length:336 start_codon:yes stop_codon:yes gene_type:complete
MRTIFFKKIENTSAIAAVGFWQPTESQLSENDIAKYAPFNNLTIYNNSDKDAEVRFQGVTEADKGVEFLPAGAALQWDTDDIKFYRPTIYNKHATLSISANDIIIQLRKVV